MDPSLPSASISDMIEKLHNAGYLHSLYSSFESLIKSEINCKCSFLQSSWLNSKSSKNSIELHKPKLEIFKSKLLKISSLIIEDICVNILRKDIEIKQKVEFQPNSFFENFHKRKDSVSSRATQTTNEGTRNNCDLQIKQVHGRSASSSKLQNHLEIKPNRMLNRDCKDAKEKNAVQIEKHGENGDMMADEETQRIKEKGCEEYKEINLIGLNSDQKHNDLNNQKIALRNHSAVMDSPN